MSAAAPVRVVEDRGNAVVIVGGVGYIRAIARVLVVAGDGGYALIRDHAAVQHRALGAAQTASGA